jgi:hypothetical protein
MEVQCPQDIDPLFALEMFYYKTRSKSLDADANIKNS